MEKFTLEYLKETMVNLWVDSINYNKTKSRVQITKEQIDNFRKNIIELIDSKNNNGKYYVELISDHTTNQELFDICKKSGIDIKILPWKSYTNLYYCNNTKTNLLIYRFGISSEMYHIYENQKCVLNPTTNKYEGLGNMVNQYVCDNKIINEVVIPETITFQQYLDKNPSTDFDVETIEDKEIYCYKQFRPLLILE